MRSVLLLLTVAALLTGPPTGFRPPAGLRPPAHGTSSAQAFVPVVPMPPGSVSAAAPGGLAASARCTDAAGTWMGMRWQTPVQWRVDTNSIPLYLGSASTVVAALRAAADNVMDAHNDCGLAADLTMREGYVGTTPKNAGVTADGGCGNQDGQNTVSFGVLKPGLLAVTCVWWVGDAGSGRSVEADILIDDSAGLFYVGDTPAGCDGHWDLQGTVTHEFGHVFGLGHVSYAQHSQLTMSDGLPDCTSGYRGLGLGDYLTLQREYGP
jgi:hypothetical protein